MELYGWKNIAFYVRRFMGTKIDYFSGMGNSLAVARDIAESINVKLISIASVLNKGIIEME